MARYQKLDERLSEEQAETLLNDYVADTKAAGKFLTYSGIALALGCSLQVLRNYMADHKDSDLYTIIESAFALVDEQNEQTMVNPENRNITGPLFALKNRGWKDEHSVNSNVTVNDSRGLFEAAQNSPIFSQTKDSTSHNVISESEKADSSGESATGEGLH